MKSYRFIATVLPFFAILLLLGSLFWILPDRVFSETENRSLAALPRFSIRRLLSGEFSSDMNTYIADQFPLREPLVRLKALCELAFGHCENDGILLGADGQLARRRFAMHSAGVRAECDSDRYDRALLEQSIQGILRAEQHLSMPFSALLTGRTLDVVADALEYPDDDSRALCRQLAQGLSAPLYIDTVEMLRQRAASGENVYYRTDHHWTMLGAYYAYEQLMREWGIEEQTVPIEAFARVSATDAFYGSSYAAAGWCFVPPDRLELWYAADEADYRVIADGRELSGFYSLSHLEGRDAYSVYLDGVHEVITVEHQSKERPRLVIFKDSFANSIAPFLARHFDLVLLNLSSPRTDYTDLSYYASLYAADRVLLLYTIENVITTDTLTRLR